MNNMGMRKVAFLDTNILHFIHLYLTEAKKRDLFPMNGDITKAQQHLSEMSDRRQRESLEKGLYVVDNLSMEDCSVQYSLASEIELMVGRARGKALVNAASEGIPDRMWNHFRDQEIHERLNEKDLLDIRSDIGNMGEMLDEAGIDATASDGGRTKDVLDLAKHIVGLVYMGVVDSVIYANALVARADHLISNDGYFLKTINRINTGDHRFHSVKNALEAHVAKLSLGDAQTITLPDAPKWTRQRR